jgi:Protein of unknown function (DUF3311)
MKKTLVYLAVPVLYVLHQDWWWWTDKETRLLGMPIGLTYHVLFCVAASILMASLVWLAWPAHLEVEAEAMKPVKESAWH